MNQEPQRPTTDDREAWKAYWAEQRMPWRTEPEIDEERQRYLAERRVVKPDIEKGIYPFRDETGGIKLKRADVEWLLATHENGGFVGPVDWSDEKQQKREGLDLRGGDLRKENLSGLPLAAVCGGKVPPKAVGSQKRQLLEWAGVQLQEADLSDARLEHALLPGAHLDDANLTRARLEGAGLYEAHLKNADLAEAYLQGAILAMAHLDDATLGDAHLEGAQLWQAILTRAGLDGAYLEQANLSYAWLDEASLTGVRAEKVDLQGAQLREADLEKAHLEHANLTYANLEDARLTSARIEGADLSHCTFNDKTDLSGVVFAAESRRWSRVLGWVKAPNAALLGDIHWDDVDLSRADWAPINRLGDEQRARMAKDSEGKQKGRRTRLKEFEVAVRANRQIATRLRAQGLNEYGDRFAYRAQLCKRAILLRQFRILPLLGSFILDLIAGYGYKPGRSFLAYLATITTFALGYYALGHTLEPQFIMNPHLSRSAALVFSVTAFHGRGFFPGNMDLNSWTTRLAAVEAVVGLFIEITFIATFTQRFFAR